LILLLPKLLPVGQLGTSEYACLGQYPALYLVNNSVSLW